MNAIVRALKAKKPVARRPRVKGAPVVVPLSASYRREDEFEGRRVRFYASCARAFEFEGWMLDRDGFHATASQVGRDGRLKDVIFSRSSVAAHDANAAPLEWLIFYDKLHDPGMRDTIARVRADAGFLFRADVEIASVSPMRSPELDAPSFGGGGSRSFSMKQIEAIESIGKLRDDMEGDLFRLLNRFVCDDEWVWGAPGTAPKKSAIEACVCALDCAAVHYHLLALQDFRDRWTKVRFRAG